MTLDTMPEVADALAGASVETVGNYFAALLASLRRVCESNGLDFDALSQSDVPAELPHVEEHASRYLALARQAEHLVGAGVESGENLLAVRSDVQTLAMGLVTEKRYQTGGKYCGKPLHVYQTNKWRLLDLFKQACQHQARQLTLTVNFPDFADGNVYQAEIAASFPRPSGFLVVAQDDCCFYRLHTAKEWEEALQASATIPTDYETTRAIYPLDNAGLVFGSVNLLAHTELAAPELPEMAT